MYRSNQLRRGFHGTRGSSRPEISGRSHFLEFQYRGVRTGRPTPTLPAPDDKQKLFGIIDVTNEMPESDLKLADTTHVKIESLSSDEVEEGKAQIENVELCASFNWKDQSDPCILVPGQPPTWQKPSIPQKLLEDAGSYYTDINSARYPSYPTEPAVRAIIAVNPGFHVTEIDVFGCGNTIGSLLSFVRGEERTFRFGAEMIGSSLFLVRKTNTVGEKIEDVRGYGHSFPEAYTFWDTAVKESESHQRIIKYDFAGLKCFVRSETDGYLPDLVSFEPSLDMQPPGPKEPKASIRELLRDTLKPSASGTSSVSTKTGMLDLLSAGKMIPQEAIFDLKTRGLAGASKSWSTGISIDDFLHRLWVNQTPNFILAFHSRGTFEDRNIHILDARPKVAAWESENRVSLVKLGVLLHKLIDTANSIERSSFEVRRVAGGKLELWSEVPGWSALPADLEKLFGSGNHADDIDEHSTSGAGVALSADNVKKEDNDDE